MPERVDFYVGYRQLPRAHKRALVVAFPILLLLMLASAWGVASRQRDPGDGFWQSGLASEWTGVVRLEPYPALHVRTGPELEPGSVALLVEMGKVGAHERAAAFDERAVTVRGRRLERSGRVMIELDLPHSELGESINPDDAGAGPADPSPFVDAGEVTLSGEILDSKCYLGAMKPGDGAAHRACATLCVRGGIPPMFFGDDGGLLLLVGPGGGTVNDDVLAWIGRPVELSGTLERRGEEQRLRLDPASVRPVGP